MVRGEEIASLKDSEIRGSGQHNSEHSSCPPRDLDSAPPLQCLEDSYNLNDRIVCYAEPMQVRGRLCRRCRMPRFDACTDSRLWRLGCSPEPQPETTPVSKSCNHLRRVRPQLRRAKCWPHLPTSSNLSRHRFGSLLVPNRPNTRQK